LAGNAPLGGGIVSWTPDTILVVFDFESLVFDVVVFICPLAACAWLGGNVLLSGLIFGSALDPTSIKI
jgi:hypothetical protein